MVLKMLKLLKVIPKYLGAALTVGVFGGLIGSAFAHAVDFVTHFRLSHPFLLYFLPLGAVATVLIYSAFRVNGKGTGDCFKAATSEAAVPFLLNPAIFISSVITHLLGGSAGREGAALQLGGSLSTPISRLFNLSEENRKGLVLSGMAAVFSALFGTPLAAAIFVFEATKTLKTAFKYIPSVLISSLSAYFVAFLCRVPAEKFIIPESTTLNFMGFWRTILVAGLSGLVCLIYCLALQFAKKGFSIIKNQYVRGIIGALAILILTLIIGNQNYNGTGSHIIASVFEGEQPKFFAFLIKILLTAITIGCGLKGGEIVPAFFIGATFGAAAATILGLPMVLGAAIGMLVLFGGSTKCPTAAFVIAFELFGLNSALLICLVPSLLTGYTMSGKPSLYNKVDFKIFKKDVQNGKEG